MSAINMRPRYSAVAGMQHLLLYFFPILKHNQKVCLIVLLCNNFPLSLACEFKSPQIRMVPLLAQYHSAGAWRLLPMVRDNAGARI